MMAALWAYNGWNELTYVSGEISNPHRNLPIALIAGIGILGTLYVFANTAYFFVLPAASVASVPLSSSVATEMLAAFLGAAAVKLMAAALVVSIFGALLRRLARRGAGALRDGERRAVLPAARAAVAAHPGPGTRVGCPERLGDRAGAVRLV